MAEYGGKYQGTPQEYQNYLDTINKNYIDRLKAQGKYSSEERYQQALGKYVKGSGTPAPAKEPAKPSGGNPAQPSGATMRGDWLKPQGEVIPYNTVPSSGIPNPSLGMGDLRAFEGTQPMAAPASPPRNPNFDVPLRERPRNAANRAPASLPGSNVPPTPFGPSFQYQPTGPTSFLGVFPEFQSWLASGYVGSNQQRMAEDRAAQEAAMAQQFQTPPQPAPQVWSGSTTTVMGQPQPAGRQSIGGKPGIYRPSVTGPPMTAPFQEQGIPYTGGGVGFNPMMLGGKPPGLARPAQQGETPPVEGDVNGDGVTNLVDILMQLLGQGGNAAVETARQEAEAAQTAGTPQGELSPVLGPNTPTKALDWMKQQEWWPWQ